MSEKDINQEISEGFKNIINRIEKDISYMDELMERYKGKDEGLIYVYLKSLLEYHRISVVNEQGIFHSLLSLEKSMYTLSNVTRNIVERSDKTLSSLKQELDSIKTEYEALIEMKECWNEALEKKKKWLNENR